MTTKTKYPEHEKLKARQRDVGLLGEFYDFLIHDQCWTIAEYPDEWDHLRPINLRPDEIIGLFLGIDPKKLEAEKRAMLDEIRERAAMTTDEHNELLRLASELSYLAIRYADLSPLLSCAEWDTFADILAGEMVAHVEQRIEQRCDEIEAKAAKEAIACD